MHEGHFGQAHSRRLGRHIYPRSEKKNRHFPARYIPTEARKRVKREQTTQRQRAHPRLVAVKTGEETAAAAHALSSTPPTTTSSSSSPSVASDLLLSPPRRVSATAAAFASVRSEPGIGVAVACGRGSVGGVAGGDEMAAVGGSAAACCAVLLAAVLLFSAPHTTEAYDSLDPNGNITIKWDIISWTPDGYVATVTMLNYQQFRHIAAPGWSLGWAWAKKEVIWSMVGAQATEQGDCSKFKSSPPHCCKKEPNIVDLLPGTPFNQQIANCCKAGVIKTFNQDPGNAASSFQISVGLAGTTNKTVKVPKNFTLKAPGPGYTCGRAIVGKPTKYYSSDGRRVTQALMSWNVTCTYSQFLAQKTPTCCVSLSSFYNDTIVSCPTCSCGCQNNVTHPGSCVNDNSPYLQSAINGPGKISGQPLVQCTNHMCPIKVHWHVKLNYKDYWRVKVTITNFNYRMNYSDWNLVAQHPNFNNITKLFSFNYKPLTPYGGRINDTAMFWGMKFYNDFLNQAGPLGNAQSEILMRKDSETFTLDKGWAFPRRVYFNGDNCVMPAPDSYPWLPNSSPLTRQPLTLSVLVFLIVLATLLAYV